MNRKVIKEPRKPIGPTIAKFLFCFLLPYLVINGLILFIFIQTPKISILDINSNDYDETKIKFYINSVLPITDIKTFFQENEVPYSKYGEYYIIDAKENGTYRITVTSLNKANINSYVEIETLDSIAPNINSDDATIIGNTLTITVNDSQSGINYDKLYAIYEDGSTIEPSYVDKASGTVQFHIDTKKKLTVYVEDLNGNSTETSFDISD